MLNRHLHVSDVEEDVQKTLDCRLDEARHKCSDEKFNAEVLEESLDYMQRWGYFRKLETEGDPLEEAKQ